MNSTVVMAILGALALAVALSRTLRRYRSTAVATTLIPQLVLLPTMLGITVFSYHTVALGMAGLAVAAVLLAGKTTTADVWKPASVVALGLAYLLPLTHTPSLDRLLLGGGTAVILFLTVRRHAAESVLASLIDGVGLYLVVNVLANMAGIANPSAAARTAGLASTSGGERVFYPLSTSLSIPPIMAAAFVAAVVLCFDGSRWRRAFRMLALLCAAVIMVQADTRVALLVAVLIGISTTVAPRMLIRLALPLSLIPLALPFMYASVADDILRPTMASVVQFVPSLSRGSEASDLTLSGRDQIWGTAIDYWHFHADIEHALVGWGVEGQRLSGASSVYGVRFQGLNSDYRSLSAHASSLQQLYDGGIVGLLALVVAVVMTVRYLSRQAASGSRSHLIALGVVVALVLTGGTEVTMSPGFAQEPFWLFATLALVAARRASSASQQALSRTAGSPSVETAAPASAPLYGAR